MKLKDLHTDKTDYRLVLIAMAKYEQGYRWINPTAVDRLDKALSRKEFSV